MLGLGTLARVAGELRRDIAAARDRDPAARGVGDLEILTAWPGVHPVPDGIDREVARLKLASLGVEIDELTAAQAAYRGSWMAEG